MCSLEDVQFLCSVFIEYKIVYLVVLLDFEDIITACNFWIVDTVLYALWSVSTVHKGLFQPFNATIKSKTSAGARCLSVLIAKSVLYLYCLSQRSQTSLSFRSQPGA